MVQHITGHVLTKANTYVYLQLLRIGACDPGSSAAKTNYVCLCSSSGWEHVVQGLVQLGFLLMDSFGPRLVFGRPEPVVTGQLTPNQAACQLGGKILLRMFKV